jgi:hypothetical protein
MAIDSVRLMIGPRNDLKMRNHLTFISTVAPVALIIGFGLVVIEADEAQASLSGKAGVRSGVFG